MIYSIEKILLDLISIQSDTGTEKECDIEKYIFNTLKESTYFSNHEDSLGLYGDKDILNRQVVWALKNNNAKDTIILVGHYDAVSIHNYGDLKEYALNPKVLREKLKNIELDQISKEDLQDENWLWGRGSCDMKAGIAINLHTILTNESKDHNILFLAVPDEENLSYGMREASKLLFDLKKKYDLKYKLLILTEPHGRNSKDAFKIHYGSVGKVMPLIFVKGKLSHVSDILKGLNPIPLLNKLVNTLDLNTELCFEDKGVKTMPPTVLGVTDLREGYDVSIPEFGAAYFNMNFLKNVAIDDIFKKILELCKEATKEYSLKLEDVYKNMDMDLRDFKFKDIEVLSYNDFKNNYIEILDNKDEIMKNIYDEVTKKVKSQEINLQEGSIYLISRLVKACNVNHPIVIIGAIPPYYAAVHNDYLVGDFNYLPSVIENIKEALQSYNLKLDIDPYFMGISDLSYTSCTNTCSESQVLENLITSPDLYTIDFEKISQLNIPVINIGPFGKDLHQNTERVYMPDVLEHIPNILKKLI